MVFVDTTVLVYAVGGPHPLRTPARDFFRESIAAARPLCTSAEVVQELLHIYLPVGRVETLDRALSLLTRAVPTVWAVEPEDVRLARALIRDHPGLSARNLVHLACCIRREVNEAMTFDRALAAALA